ncbi:MAG: tripartite tricarboxylate transporter substrate binding protein [Renibacterium sp.]|nr:tripartite tricarboxylate transporter substrate binding protein [Renibacterium sp.]
MTQILKRAAFIIALVSVTAVAGVNAASSGGIAAARSKLTIIAPAAPGGGFDSFSRELQNIMKSNAISNNVQVVNIPGAGGTIGLSKFLTMTDREDLLLTTGSAMVGAISLTGAERNPMLDTVPIAKLSNDYSSLSVPSDSPFQTLADFITAFTANPKGTSIAGGSLGSIGHLMMAELAIASGVAATELNFIAYPGGGRALNALLSKTTDVLVSNVTDIRDQVEAGNLRILAVSSANRLSEVDAPTFTEQGIPVVMSNWRGLLAPPGTSETTRAELLKMIEESLKTEQWQSALSRYEWDEDFLSGAAFEAFITEEFARTDLLVRELGLR